MPISSINRVKTIAHKLPTNNEAINIIYGNSNPAVGGDFLPGHKIFSFNSFIKNLKLFSSIQSVDEAPLPEFDLADSATAKLTKVLDVEWNSPRKQINLCISNNTDPAVNTWHQVGSISLLNPFDLPFRVYNVLDLFTDNLAFELGENGKIGIQVENVGYGLLSTEDKVTMHGSYTQEMFLQSPDVPNITNINVSGVAAAPSTPPSSFISNSTLLDNQFLISN